MRKQGGRPHSHAHPGASGHHHHLTNHPPGTPRVSSRHDRVDASGGRTSSCPIRRRKRSGVAGGRMSAVSSEKLTTAWCVLTRGLRHSRPTFTAGLLSAPSATQSPRLAARRFTWTASDLQLGFARRIMSAALLVQRLASTRGSITARCNRHLPTELPTRRSRIAQLS